MEQLTNHNGFIFNFLLCSISIQYIIKIIEWLVLANTYKIFIIIQLSRTEIFLRVEIYIIFVFNCMALLANPNVVGQWPIKLILVIFVYSTCSDTHFNSLIWTNSSDFNVSPTIFRVNHKGVTCSIRIIIALMI